MRYAFALLLAGLAVAAGHAINYCGAKMCGYKNTHTFCQYPEGPSPNCIGYMDARLSAEEKALVLARLNRRRSEAASGNLRNMPSAGNMLKLRWMEELAREAQIWADQCRPPSTPEERDMCRDLYSITVGQCVASVVGEAPGLRVETMVDLWYMQAMHYKENVTSYVESTSKGNYYADFAQMIWAKSYMVGCGRSRFMSEWHGRLRIVERLVCNIFPRGPSPGRPLWSPAPPSAACPPRSTKDLQLPALCNFQAGLDVTTDIDGAMSIEEHILLSTVLEIEDKESPNYLGSLDELYLTKLAIVTMENTVTPALVYYNPMHKRDIVDTFSLDFNFINNNNSNNVDFFETINATMGVTEVSIATPKIIYKKVKIIGRPKSYNLEELTVNEPLSLQQINTKELEFTKVDRDLYLDDESISTEVNITSTGNFSVFTENVLKEIDLIEYNESQTNNASISATESKDIAYITKRLNEVVVTYNASRFENVNNSVVISSTVSDDYLTDSESVRELEEALEGMEHSLGMRSQNSGKFDSLPKINSRALHDALLNPSLDYEGYRLRRELRDFHPKNVGNVNITNNHQDLSEDIFMSTDRSPMLNMVLKYIPYLKPYEKEILGSASRCCLIKLSHTVARIAVLVLFLL